jgi:hypothetical protein
MRSPYWQESSVPCTCSARRGGDHREAASEYSTEFFPVYAVGILMCNNIRIPPVGCRAFELMWGKQNHLSVVALHDLKFLLMVLSQSSASIGST